MAPLVPHPDTSGPGDEQISVPVHFHPVGHALAFTSGFLAEDPTVLYRAVARKLIDAHIALLAVIHVEALAIGRECQSIGLCQPFGQKVTPALFVQPINSLEWNLLFFSWRQIKSGIREIDSAVWSDDHVIRTVE